MLTPYRDATDKVIDAALQGLAETLGAAGLHLDDEALDELHQRIRALATEREMGKRP